MTKLLPLAALALAVSAGSLPASTWIGQVSDQHCTPEHKALPGDDDRCVVFIANDHQVYTIANQDAVKPHIGHEVLLSGTLDEQVIIGISYQTQGIIKADSVKMISALELTPEEKTRFQTMMKGMQPKVLAVREVIVSKDKAPLAANSDKLAAALEEVGVFMRAHHSEDGVKLADTARDAAKAIGTAQVQVEQILALRKVNETCTNCHISHRAGKIGDFKIQP